MNKYMGTQLCVPAMRVVENGSRTQLCVPTLCFNENINLKMKNFFTLIVILLLANPLTGQDKRASVLLSSADANKENSPETGNSGGRFPPDQSGNKISSPYYL